MDQALTLYTRAGCHLCDHALEVADELRRVFGVHVSVLDVDAEPGTRALYGERVPVLVHGRTVIAQAGDFHPDDVLDRLNDL